MVNIKKLKAAMVLNGDNITTLAKAIGVSRSTLSATLNGRREMLVGELMAIVERYNLTAEQVDEIFFPDSDPAAVVAPVRRVPVIEMGKPVPDSFLQWLDEKEAAAKNVTAVKV